MLETLQHKKQNEGGSVWSRYFKSQVSKTLQESKLFLPFIQQIQKLEEEIAFLTSYSSDTAYRVAFEDGKHSYDYISPAIIKLLGYGAEEFSSLEFSSLIQEIRIITNGTTSLYAYDALESYYHTHPTEQWRAEYRLQKKDGSSLWVSDTSRAWQNAEGTTIGIIGCLRDITDNVHMEKATQEALFQQACTDSLTGLANRREFFKRLNIELKRINRSGSPVSILLIDIDHFKAVNDSYGHDIGDTVLVEISALMASCLRQTDLVARLGGEEFAVLLPDTPADGAYWVAERINKAAAQHPFCKSTMPSPIECTVSIGIAAASPDDNALDASSLYKLADSRLYVAKNMGRNQISVDGLRYIH